MIRYQFKADGCKYTLVITKCTEVDKGGVRFTAFNSAGDAKSTAKLTVQPADPEMYTTSPEEQDCVAGQDIKLEVELEGMLLLDTQILAGT